ncbi:hypothetical protein ABT144_24510 [Streptomyces sp. NPDC002039]|uniref:hypothetical protein n=1 Tax=Streptomyces sp. NPDC002039 TaxID=3154660 RepID=UPI0033303B8E
MRVRTGTGTATVLLVVSALFVPGCGTEASKDTGTAETGSTSKPAAGAGASADSGASTAEFSTVFNTEQKIQAALPDPASMKGWKPKTGRANVVEQPTPLAQCGADWECAAVANGSAKFEEVGETVIFRLHAFTDHPTAQDACRKEAAQTAKYTKASVAPLDGAESHAYYRNAGGLDGINVSLCLGTVVGRVTIEGGGSNLDPETAHSMARTLIDRVRTAAAAS